MALEVEREPSNWDRWPKENCCMCRKPTSYWWGTGKTNVALCPDCASTAEASDLPTKAEWFAKERAANNTYWWQS